jgi:hypothetical protein
MIKRLFGLLIGLGVGFGSSFVVIEVVRSRLDGGDRAWGEEIRTAVAEGRTAMQQREAELRAEFELR